VTPAAGCGVAGRAWSGALRGVVLPLGDRLFGQRMMARLRELEAAQWWPAERVAAERARDLGRLIRVAHAEVPFYRDLYEAAGVDPRTIRDPADLERLPVATKAMLRAAYPERTRRATGRRPYVTASSGSTGANFYVLEDAATAGRYRAAFLLALEWAGWRIGEPHLQTGMTLERPFAKRLKDRLLRCHYASAFRLDDAHLDAILDRLERHRLRHLWGYPGSLYLLARRARERGWNRPLRSVVTWGDTLYAHYRRTIEEAFGTRVTDTYGCGEGIQAAAQCEAGTYHVHALDVVVEVVDDEGRSVAPGERGNLLLTRLHPGPMPLIRYRVGDVGIRGTGACPCGRSLETLGAIEGRDTDFVVTPSGNRLIVHFFTGILEHFPEVASFQVVQEELDAVRLRIVPAAGYADAVGARIVAALRLEGADLDIQVELIDELPLPASGKRRFVVSRIAA
jgi:phenylacetate-CoA ligase